MLRIFGLLRHEILVTQGEDARKEGTMDTQKTWGRLLRRETVTVAQLL
jgi:hypothetical protein